MKDLILDDTKLPYHKERLKAWLDGERVSPITVEWALSRRCTYRCRYDNYCYTERERTEPDVITKEIAYRFLESASKIGVKAVPLGCDGESTCNDIIYDVIPYSTEVGLDTALSTNGYTLRDEKLDIILPHLKYLRFNISAATPDMYAYIMGCHEKCLNKVINTIKNCVRIKRENGLDVTIGLQMVLMPQFSSEVIPLAKLGKEIGVDYTVIKHCADDRIKGLGIDYNRYKDITHILRRAEMYSTKNYKVIIKWSKMMGLGKRIYKYCYGPIFLQQISSSGTVGPCGTFFNESDKWFNVGSILTDRFEDIVHSEHYWEVMNHIGSDRFDNNKCWDLCFQHKINEFLWNVKEGVIDIDKIKIHKETPKHVNFV